MAVTKAIPTDELEPYFAEFTRRFLKDDSPEAADVEVVDAELGDLTVAQGARLLGITYEPPTHSLEFEFDVGDHRVLDPHEVWTMEEPDGFLNSVGVVHGDGTRDVVNIRRVGLRRAD